MPYGTFPYAGYHPAVLVPSQNRLGVPFLVGNDRNQIIVCADSGTNTTNPQWRYWYGGGAPWGGLIALDTNFPTFHMLDEDGEAVDGSVEFPFREFLGRKNVVGPLMEVTIEGVLVEFTPMPLVVDTAAPVAVQVGFSGRVEAYGQPSMVESMGSQVTGVKVSDTFAFSEALQVQPSEPWPNIRTTFLPLRLQGRYRGARVILTSIHLVEINRVILIGDPGVSRQA